MAELNKVILLGNLTRDPELRQTPQGTSVCTLGLAVNRRYTTSSGESREETCFVDVDVWAAQAESCAGYLRKGSPALVEGRLRFNEWQDRESGARRTRLTVQARSVQFMGPPGKGAFGQARDSAPANGQPLPEPGRGNRAGGPPEAAPRMPDFEPIDEQHSSDASPDTMPF